MSELEDLFDNNRAWAESMQRMEPTFFQDLSKGQSPAYLWIGCADSRVPASQVIGLQPGEVFVHRNVANLVVHTDLNLLSVLQYAVDVLQVRHVLVVGHYGCGGVRAAYGNADNGLIDNWLRHIKEVQYRHRAQLETIVDKEQRLATLCELNVQSQVANVCHTSIVQHAWRRDQRLSVHGWIYNLQDGLLKDLGCTVESAAGVADAFRVVN
ncbi:MAG: carbonate dehydratase [Halioglobus sp.]|nr:carbonate dehydratase [Halioglobus sp.]